MRYFLTLLVSVIFFAGCNRSENVSTQEDKLVVYSAYQEAKIVSFYENDALVFTVTFDGTNQPTISPPETPPLALITAIAIMSQQIPEYNADIFYYTTPPPE